MIAAILTTALAIGAFIIVVSGVNSGSTLPMLCGTLIFPVAVWLSGFTIGRASKKLRVEVADVTHARSDTSAMSIDYEQVAAAVVAHMRAQRKPHS